MVLNHTNPNATQSCWLCYNLHCPFYEAIGLNVSYHLSSGQNPPQCPYEEHKVGLTMNEVWGQGLCLGTVPRDKTPLCAQTITYAYTAKIGLCQRLGVGGFVHILG